MNEELLITISSDLTLIKWVLIIFVTVFILFILLAGAFFFYVSKDLASELKTPENFRIKGQKLLDKGELEQVIELAKNKLEEYPSHNYAIYFLAISYYRMENIHESYRLFKQLKELAPSWSEYYINPYLSELEIKIKNNKPELLK